MRAATTVCERPSFWRPSFARSLVPELTALEPDLKQYLGSYNFDRAHTGRLTRGRTPGRASTVLGR
jgi:hypothetical protein